MGSLTILLICLQTHEVSLAQATRRSFLADTAALIAAAVSNQSTGTASATHTTGGHDPLNIVRLPDGATAYIESHTANKPSRVPLSRSGSSWQSTGIQVRASVNMDSLAIGIAAPAIAIVRIHLRWHAKPSPAALYMGDAWERSYGELAWRTIIPERILPWYFASHNGRTTHSYGVRTGAAALCFWQVDPEGVSLWLDLSNGGSGVLLGQRELAAATIISREGAPGETPLASLQGLCRLLCPHPRLPAEPVYGSNDWYYAYGNNTADGILRDTDLIASLAPAAGPRPFSVIDAGWENNPRFPDMAQLSEQIRSHRARPGIWIRPTDAPRNAQINLLLPAMRLRAQSARDNEVAYDPTIPESLELILAKVKQVVGWNYDLIKHDFSTYDLLGQWGFDMGAQPTLPGWNFHDRSRTNAEIILELYRSLRAAAGERTLLLGCNTVAHLAAGLFEIQRTGDDTSGREWERTRRMGVNTLAYRLPQHRTFFDLDADCVGITNSIPWELNRQWLDVLARSGTSLFISPGPDAIGPEQRAAIKEAFAIASAGASTGLPTDWLTATTPEQWDFKGSPKHYGWTPDGADPFST